jgi:hypothetical protein
MPVDKKVTMELLSNGNASAIMARFVRAARCEAWPENEIDVVLEECQNGDHNYLLQTICKYTRETSMPTDKPPALALSERIAKEYAWVMKPYLSGILTPKLLAFNLAKSIDVEVRPLVTMLDEIVRHGLLDENVERLQRARELVSSARGV